MTPPPLETVAARLCSPAAARLALLVRRIKKSAPEMWGVESRILRLALCESVLHPPLAAALRDYPCPRGGGVAAMARIPSLDTREGVATLHALRQMNACFPEGSVHRFIEHGMTQEEHIVFLLRHASPDEREDFFERVIARSVYDIRPALAKQHGG